MASSYLDELNEVQRQAATHVNGAALVIAVPGAGKTRVLTYRIANLIHQGVPPDQILALTFTNKAAREMKERIEKVVGNDANQIWAGTFHSIFARILRAEAPKIGYPSDFSIYDSTDTKSLLGDIIKGQGLDKAIYTPNAVYHRISNAKNNLISPERYRNNGDFLLEDKTANMPYIYKLYDLYVQRCKRAGAMDFDDLLYQMHELLKENPDDVTTKYRRKFRYVLVDEFQDTNPLQYSIIQHLVSYQGSTQNIFVVGDDAQSIYGFRGATIQNILDFEKDYPNLQVFKLEQNYRSTNYIVQAANDVIAHNRRQFKKTIRSERGEGNPIRIIRAVTDTEEAKQVAELIVEQRNRYHYQHQDFAVLYRTNAQSRVFEEALKNYRIPYKVYGGMSFYERKEIKDALAYLRVVANPLDEEALKRIINYPARGIGDKSIDEVVAEAEKREMSLWEMLKKVHEVPTLQARTVPYIRNFVNMIEMFRLRLLQDNAYELATYVIKMSGILDDLKSEKTAEAQERVENLMELLDGIKTFVENDEITINTSVGDKTLTSYLQNVILLTDIEDDDENGTNRVKLMSVHSAKGLEFKSVFVVGLEENLFPSAMALKGTDARSGIDEERRLFYVAITRAELLLTLTYASSRYRFGKMAYNNSSRFIEEISPKWLDTEGVLSYKGASISGAGIKKAMSSPVSASPVPKPMVAPSNFRPSPVAKLVTGAKIQHERFGTGKIVGTEGDGDQKIAIILFEDGVGEKRIMLKFAKLMVL